MKTLIYLFLSILLLISPSCGLFDDKVSGTDCTTTLTDITDPDNVDYIASKELYQFLPVLNNLPLRGAELKASYITDLRHNPVHTIHIPATDKMNSNEIDRKKKIALFRVGLDSILNISRTIDPGRQHSEIFSAISKAINDLAECSTCETRRLIVASDLHQHNEQFSIYAPASINKLKDDLDCLEELLPIKHRLDNMEIYLLHTTTVKDDKLFDFMASAIKEYLEREGATVHVVTTLSAQP